NRGGKTPFATTVQAGGPPAPAVSGAHDYNGLAWGGKNMYVVWAQGNQIRTRTIYDDLFELDSSSDTGTYDDDEITSSRQLLFNIATDRDLTVKVYRDGSNPVVATADGEFYTATANVAADGTYNFQAEGFDNSNNLVWASDILPVTV